MIGRARSVIRRLFHALPPWLAAASLVQPLARASARLDWRLDLLTHFQAEAFALTVLATVGLALSRRKVLLLPFLVLAAFQAEPLVRWLGARVNGVLPVANVARLDLLLTQAGDWYGLTADELVGAMIACGVAMAALGGGAATLGSNLGVAVFATLGGGIVGSALPYFVVDAAKLERLRIINRTLPNAIDLMALSMSAGLDFPGAVRQVVEKTSNPEDPLVEEFTLILQGMNLGRSRKEALLEFAKRAPVETVTEFVNSLVQAEERGNPVAEVLAIQATVSRTRRSVRAEELAAKAGVQMVGPLMLVFFCIMGLLMGPALMNIMAGL